MDNQATKETTTELSNFYAPVYKDKYLETPRADAYGISQCTEAEHICNMMQD
jgi:hypothetical protein